MKKIFISLLLLVLLTSCWVNQNNNLQSTEVASGAVQSWSEKTESNAIIEKQVNIQNTIQKNLYTIRQDVISQNPDLQGNLTQYNNLSSHFAELLWIWESQLRILLPKYEKILNDYFVWQKTATGSMNTSLQEQTEKFLVTNFKNDGVIVSQDKIHAAIVDPEFQKFLLSFSWIKDYTLPDGSIVTKELKKSYDEYEKSQLQWSMAQNPLMIDEWKYHMNSIHLSAQWNCDQMLDPISQENCKARKK